VDDGIAVRQGCLKIRALPQPKAQRTAVSKTVKHSESWGWESKKRTAKLVDCLQKGGLRCKLTLGSFIGGDDEASSGSRHSGGLDDCLPSTLRVGRHYSS